MCELRNSPKRGGSASWALWSGRQQRQVRRLPQLRVRGQHLLHGHLATRWQEAVEDRDSDEDYEDVEEEFEAPPSLQEVDLIGDIFDLERAMEAPSSASAWKKISRLRNAQCGLAPESSAVLLTRAVLKSKPRKDTSQPSESQDECVPVNYLN